MTKAKVATVLLVGLVSCSRHGPVPDVSVHDAVLRLMPNGAGALYATIVNATEVPDRLRSVEVTGARQAQLHETVHDGDVVGMRPAEGGFEIPAHGTLTLEKGGRHVMLFAVQGSPSSLPVTFHFATAKEVVIDVRVEGAMR